MIYDALVVRCRSLVCKAFTILEQRGGPRVIYNEMAFNDREMNSQLQEGSIYRYYHLLATSYTRS